MEDVDGGGMEAIERRMEIQLIADFADYGQSSSICNPRYC